MVCTGRTMRAAAGIGETNRTPNLEKEDSDTHTASEQGGECMHRRFFNMLGNKFIYFLAILKNPFCNSDVLHVKPKVKRFH